jgi:hypothetical protein
MNYKLLSCTRELIAIHALPCKQTNVATYRLLLCDSRAAECRTSASVANIEINRRGGN